MFIITIGWNHFACETVEEAVELYKTLGKALPVESVYVDGEPRWHRVNKELTLSKPAHQEVYWSREEAENTGDPK